MSERTISELPCVLGAHFWGSFVLFGSINPHLYSTHKPNMVTAGQRSSRSSWRSYTGQLFWKQTCRAQKSSQPCLHFLQGLEKVSGGGSRLQFPWRNSMCCPPAMGAMGCCAPQTLISAWPAPSEPQAEPHHPLEPGQPHCLPNTKAGKAGQPCSPPALLRASSPALT